MQESQADKKDHKTTGSNSSTKSYRDGEVRVALYDILDIFDRMGLEAVALEDIAVRLYESGDDSRMDGISLVEFGLFRRQLTDLKKGVFLEMLGDYEENGDIISYKVGDVLVRVRILEEDKYEVLSNPDFRHYDDFVIWMPNPMTKYIKVRYFFRRKDNGNA